MFRIARRIFCLVLGTPMAPRFSHYTNLVPMGILVTYLPFQLSPLMDSPYNLRLHMNHYNDLDLIIIVKLM